ncbi:MAG: hypothetical protein C0473_02935 [Cyanobacteria bacterium DS3.002]|nr:hypothetical protein [Cyanobacteria bacterium DS3.002]MBA4049821.1 hypothetical protein [Cyanobacteria bacterium DS2.008]MBA4076911.1 hypothetical protein [Cyanobacteria bacterium PR.023]
MLEEHAMELAKKNEEKAVQENEVLQLSQRDREAFVAAIINPPAASKELLAAAKRFKARMGK